MTRINIVPVDTLFDQHLLAEHREIKRVPNCIKKGKYSLQWQPEKYTMGTGHVKFFYDKLKYLSNRYQDLHKECIKRGFNVEDYSDCFQDVPQELDNNYSPDDDAFSENKQRLDNKYLEKPNFYRFYWVII